MAKLLWKRWGGEGKWAARYSGVSQLIENHEVLQKKQQRA